MKVSLGGMLILLSIFLGVIAAEIIAYLNTTTTSNLSLPGVSAFFLIIALVFGFIGFYSISEILHEK